MLTVKLIHKNFDSGHEETHVFEASYPEYKYISPLGYEGWCEAFKSNTNDYLLPSKTFMDRVGPDEDIPYYNRLLVFTYLDEHGDKQVLFIQNSTIFIMQDGKTVDKVSC